MNKKQLIRELSNRTGLSLIDSDKYLNVILSIITSSLRNGEGVFLRKFGSFMIRERKSKRVKEIATKKIITIPSKKKVKFTTQILNSKPTI